MSLSIVVVLVIGVVIAVVVIVVGIAMAVALVGVAGVAAAVAIRGDVIAVVVGLVACISSSLFSANIFFTVQVFLKKYLLCL